MKRRTSWILHTNPVLYTCNRSSLFQAWQIKDASKDTSAPNRLNFMYLHVHHICPGGLCIHQSSFWPLVNWFGMHDHWSRLFGFHYQTACSWCPSYNDQALIKKTAKLHLDQPSLGFWYERFPKHHTHNQLDPCNVVWIAPVSEWEHRILVPSFLRFGPGYVLWQMIPRWTIEVQHLRWASYPLLLNKLAYVHTASK